MAELSHKSFLGRARNERNNEADLAAAREAMNKRLAAVSKAASPNFCEQAFDRRKSERKAVSMTGRIFVNKVDAHKCDIINLSADGARVALEEETALPQFVVLKFDDSDVQKRARIAWQHNNEFGISFLRNEKPDN